MKVLFLFLGLSLSLNALANQYWTETSNSARNSDSLIHYQLDIDAFNTSLSLLAQQPSVIIDLPRSNGGYSSFRVSQTQVLAPDLAYKYPNLKTFKIQHITNPSIRGRMELIDDQLSVMVNANGSQELLNPSANLSSFQSYHVQNKGEVAQSTFSCGTKMHQRSTYLSMKLPENNQYRIAPNKLKKLRVAIATTVEYSAEFGNTKQSVLAEIAKALNRINEVFESELAITLELVSNNEDIIFLNSDLYDNDDADQMLSENQTIIDNAIVSLNYDLGHVFSTGGGGLATVASVCSDFKANGITGRSSPRGDPFWIDYVAHEMGHQLGANHTFNGSSQSCGGSREPGNAYEPGSGSTIMAYAGICLGENLQSNSDASFHSKSIEEIEGSFPSNCGANVSYGSIHTGFSNINKPIVNASLGYVIPTNTPFLLTASASDLDDDDLYYQWDSADSGALTAAYSIGCDLKDNTLFRSNAPKQESVRYFPTIETLLSGLSYVGETLPTTDRAININVKVTDNKGGYATDNISITSVTSSNKFAVTSQATAQSFSVGDVVTVKWDVANTYLAPVNCTAVDIQLLSFNADKSKFAIQDLTPSGEINSGTAVLRLPFDGNSASSRFLVKCRSGIFFAINNADFSITGGLSDAPNDIVSSDGGIAINFSTQIDSNLQCPFEIKEVVPVTGSGSLPIGLIFMLSGLFLARRSV